MGMRHLGQAANLQPLGFPMAGQEYLDTVLGIQSESRIAFWPLNETSGSVAKNIDDPDLNGTFSSVTLNSKLGIDSQPAPLWVPGSGSYSNIYSATLNTLFNGDVGQVCGWAQVSAAGVWTDGAVREIFYIQTSTNDQLVLRKNNANNQLRLITRRSGNFVATLQALSETAFFWWSLEMSAPGVNCYIRPLGGAEINFTAVNANAWTGNLNAATTLIGCANVIPANIWSGYNQFVAIWAGVNLTEEERAALALA